MTSDAPSDSTGPIPTLSVIIPCLNEENRLGATLDEVVQWARATRRAIEILVVDNGSTDGTADLVACRMADVPELRLVEGPDRPGKGAAVRAGMAEARGELRAFIDADGATPFAEIEQLEDGIRHGADVAVGSRVLDPSRIEARPHRRVLGVFFRALVRWLAVRTVEDTQCGFKLFRAKAASALFSEQLLPGFAFDVEVLARAERLGLSIAEVPIRWRDQPGSKVRPLRDGLEMVGDVIRLRSRLGSGFGRSGRLQPAGRYDSLPDFSSQGSPHQRRMAGAVALVVALLVFVTVGRELAGDTPDLNDSALHLALIKEADAALDRSESPLDFWFAGVGLGFPVFRHYQHLPHVTVVGIHRLLLRSVDLATLYRWSIAVLLALFPVSMFLALRRLGLHPLVSACAAFVAPLLSTPDLFGLGLESYLWAGRGLYTQLFASVLAPVAFAGAYHSVQTGRRMVLAAVLIAATFLSHLVYGYAVALSTLVALALRTRYPLSAATSGDLAISRSRDLPSADHQITRSPDHQMRQDRVSVRGTPAFNIRVLRLAAILAAAFLAASYFFVPAIRDTQFVNHSVWEDRFKWDSLGAGVVLGHLARGTLFDSGRPPVVTALFALGLAHAIWRGSAQLRALAALTLGWLLLYFGRPTWGAAMDLLPFGSELPLHRLSGAVHLFAIPLAGYGLALLLTAIGNERSRRLRAAAALALCLALLLVVRERVTYVARSVTLKEQSGAAIRADSDVQALLDQLSTLRGGRVYLGIRRLPRDVIRIGEVPLTAMALVRNIDTLGYLWHAMSFAGDIQVWFDPDNEVHCRTFGVRYLVFEPQRPPPSFAQLIRQVGRFRIYEVSSASYLTVADVPGTIRRSKSAAYAVGFAWLNSRLPPFGAYPALEHAASAGPIDVQGREAVDAFAQMPIPAGAAGTVTRVIDEWSAQVTVGRPSAVVLRANYHPSLAASVDEQPATVFPVAPSYAAVSVPQGIHTVRFRYAPGHQWPWIIVGVLGAVLVIRAVRPLKRCLATAPSPCKGEGWGEG